MPEIILDNLVNGTVNPIYASKDVAIDRTNLTSLQATTSQEGWEELQMIYSIVLTLSNINAVTGRGFQRRNDNTLSIDNTNIDEFQDINTIYAAGIDKNVNWTLPSQADITASATVDYPIVFEFTHLGGTSRTPAPPNQNLNRVNIFVHPDDITTGIRINSRGLTVNDIDLLRDEVLILSKESASSNWVANFSIHDANTRILPSGTWEFNETNPNINNIANIATELSSVVVNKGDVFIVETGGDYFNTSIGDNSLIVALVDSPNLTTNDGEDWYIINDGKSVLNNNQIAFLNQITRTGTRFDLSKNVFVNESNVIEFNSQGSGVPLQLSFHNANGDGTAQAEIFSNQNIQFTGLQGGTLSLTVSFSTSSFSGFLPDLQSLVFDFNGTTFSFPLTNINIDGGIGTIDITIPNADYTSALNTNCDITLNYVYRGANFVGSFTIQGLVNTFDGTLRQAVTNIANNSAMLVEQRLETQIDNLAREINDENSALSALEPRLLQEQNISVTTPDVNVLFLDSTGSDSPPTDLSTMTSVSSSNPRFTVTGTHVFVAVIGGGTYTFKNITQSSEFPLVDSNANVSVLASRSFNNTSYFIYRVSNLTANDVIEVDDVTIQTVIKERNDIKNLQEDVNRIDAELRHAALNLPDEVVQVLENEVSVTEETSPTSISNLYNNSLSSNGTQAIFYESSPIAGSGGVKNSKPISENSGNDRFRNKLLYIPDDTAYANQVYVTAFDGVSTNTDLISYSNGEFYAKQFVPAIPAGSTTDTVYLTTSTNQGIAGTWVNVRTLTFVNGFPEPEAVEVFFTKNVTSGDININYRGHANGNIFGENSTTLPSGQNSITFVLNDGSEQATVEVRRWQGNSIRVSVTESVNTGLPTINDIEVKLSYSRTVTVPATPATARDVLLEHLDEGKDQVFAFRRLSNGNLAIIGTLREVDTGYSYVTLFGATEVGNLSVTNEDATFLDYQNFTPITTSVVDLENHSVLPQFGLFSTTYTHETVVNLDTQLTVKDDSDKTINVGNKLSFLGDLDVKYHSLDSGVSSTPTTDTTEAITIRGNWSGNEDIEIIVDGVSVNIFSNLSSGTVHALKYTITSAQWSSMTVSSNVITYTIEDSNDNVLYNGAFRNDL